METSLHRQLKAIFGPDRGGRAEVFAEGFRADAVAADGEWVEVQSGPLGPLKGKLDCLLPRRRVRIIKPVVLQTRIIRRARSDGPDVATRLSPRRGELIDVFDDLVGVARVFPNANLCIDVLGVAIDEVRVPRRRWPGYRVADRRLREIRSTTKLQSAMDLWELIPQDLPGLFTTVDLAARIARPVHFAQRVAYCLRLSGAVLLTGKMGNRIIYSRPKIRRRPRRIEASHERA